jgi:hypothetical protein
VKQEDEGKFRCKTCQKLFKATSFVEKHIANKHGELVKQLDELPFFNNFALDPYRIQPMREPPPPPPPAHHGAYAPDHGRGAPHGHQGGGAYGAYPPPYAGGYGGRDAHGGHAYGGAPHAGGGRLSDRIGGFDGSDAGLPAGVGLPPKPAPSLDQPLQPARGGDRGRRGPPPPPPADAKEDPRAAAGRRVSYHDMDSVAEGEVELQY